MAPPVRAQSDLDAGRRLFRACRSCHEIGRGAGHRMGPHLNGLIGRKAGALPDFPYSLPMTAAGLRGLVWTEKTLDAYIADPQRFIRGTIMPHVGFRKPADRRNLVAYIREASQRETKEQAKLPVKTSD
ncbi:MAG: c-type cytochrome [Neomegalonema sp.]|nr:c-type cytochrome [Neomegalonema sp.]